MASDESVSQAEIWDDSMLVNSWNEALEEYEKYHSIHARGEKVDDVLKAAEEDEEDGEISTESMTFKDGQVHDGRLPDQRAKRNMTEETADEGIAPRRTDAPASAHKTSNTPGQTSDGTQSQGPAIPAHLIGQVHNDGLKNLLMSWYYAGYYTGLYEGQQRPQDLSGQQAKQ